jgi:Tfp pilus assembly protein PilF
MRNLLFLLSLLGAISLWTNAAHATFIEYLRSSERLEIAGAATDLANGRVAAAEAKFEAVLGENPASWASMLGLADIAYGRGDEKRVGVLLRDAREAAPHNAAVQTAWGRYLYLGAQYEEAEQAFLQAARIDPALAAPHGELGALYFARLGKPEQALEHYRNAIALAPRNTEYRYALASLLSQQKQLGKALEEISAARAIEPEAAYPLQLKANLLAAHNQTADALAALSEARELEPDNPQIAWARGELHMQARNYNAARQAYREMLDIAPNAYAAHTRIGLSYQLEDNFPMAERSYADALSIEPRDAIALNNLAYGVLEQPERIGEALQWAERAVALVPGNPDYLDTLGLAQLRASRLAEAVRTLEQALTLAPDYPPVNLHLAQAYEQQGDLAKARRHYQHAASGAGQEADVARQRLRVLQ